MKWLTLILLMMPALADIVTPVIAPNTSRPWPGRDFWANPAEDWQLNNNRLENRFSGGARNLVILTGEVVAEKGDLTAKTRVDQVSFELLGDGYVGFEVGRQGTEGDYRDSAVNGAGLPVGIDFSGRPFIGKADPETPTLELPIRNLTLEFKAEPANGDLYLCSLRAIDAAGRNLSSCRTEVHGSRIEGLIALVASTHTPKPGSLTSPRPANLKPTSQTRGGEGRFTFSHLSLSGSKLFARPDRAFGPILWATYTLDNTGKLRLLVQAAPFAQSLKLESTLELPGRETKHADLDPTSRTALFRVLKVPTDRDTPYKVTLKGETFEGVIKAIPKNRKVTVASLSCNDSTGFPHQRLVANVAAQKPDLITFHGDQIYESIGGYGLIYDQRPNDRALISYLRKYYLHGWTWREILRNTPSITIPDDHDVFHGNLWGAGGAASDISEGFGNTSQDSGGYKMSVEFVNAVHRTQTGNLPEPADPAACRSGISVYFTRYPFGPLDIAILSDRQFKSAPANLLAGAKIDNGWPQKLDWDPVTQASHPEAELLGPRQEAYLRRWAKSPAPGTTFRVAVSQSPWCAPQTLPTDMHHDRGVPDLPVYKPGEYAPDDEPKPDFDTNGWPQEKRNLALGILRDAKAVHLTGDQHLATTGQYGLEGWNDGSWWLSTPAIANIWPRRWMPATDGANRRSGDPKWLGEFKDGFGNPFTIHAVANPHDIDREPSRLFDRAVGYAISTWDPANGQVSLAAWPYWASPAKPAPDNAPYPGWPIIINPSSGKRLR